MVAEVVRDDDGYVTFEALGLTHRIRVYPNEDYSGWIVQSSSPLGAVNLPQDEAEMLARFLLAGPGPVPIEQPPVCPEPMDHVQGWNSVD